MSFKIPYQELLEFITENKNDCYSDTDKNFRLHKRYDEDFPFFVYFFEPSVRWPYNVCFSDAISELKEFFKKEDKYNFSQKEKIQKVENYITRKLLVFNISQFVLYINKFGTENDIDNILLNMIPHISNSGAAYGFIKDVEIYGDISKETRLKVYEEVIKQKGLFLDIKSIEFVLQQNIDFFKPLNVNNEIGFEYLNNETQQHIAFLFPEDFSRYQKNILKEIAVPVKAEDCSKNKKRI